MVKNTFIKKCQKLIFGYKSTPDGLPDPEKFYPGVLGHAESDFDGPGAPKYPKTLILGAP